MLAGLDINTDTIIEIACIVTDGSLEIQIEVSGICIVCFQKVCSMFFSEWCLYAHYQGMQHAR